jgi:hypothetical protein
MNRSIVSVPLYVASFLAATLALRATTATSLSSFDGVEEPSVIYHPSTATFTNDSFINITTLATGDFKFYLRYTGGSSGSWDGDRATTNNDRQRAEVRGLGTHQVTGETYDYQSTWRTDSATRIGNLFYHITQVKAADGDNNAPLVTISLVNGSTAQVDKCSGSEQGLTAIRQFSWAPATWTTTKIRLKTATDSTGMLKLSVNGDTLQGASGLPMYRPSATSYWPKWGLYRGADTTQPYSNNYVEHTSLSSNKFVGTTDTTVTSADGFFNRSLGSTQTGSFSVDFDASVSLSPSNTTFSLCQGNATAYTGLACMVRFNTTGTIDARNGGAFAAVNSVSFSANTTYHIHMDVNVGTHTYSASVTAPGGSPVTIASNYAFRSEQASVTSLNTFDVDVNATPGGSATFSDTTVSVPTSTKFNIPGTSVIASADDGNVPANTVDGSLSTRWSASGDGQWIRYDIGSTKTVTSVKVAFYSGDVRTSSFDVQVSSDGTNFTTIGSYTSSGTTLNLETFNVPDSSARYVRLLGHGNSVNLWNSYTEVELWGF